MRKVYVESDELAGKLCTLMVGQEPHDGTAVRKRPRQWRRYGTSRKQHVNYRKMVFQVLEERRQVLKEL